MIRCVRTNDKSKLVQIIAWCPQSPEPSIDASSTPNALLPFESRNHTDVQCNTNRQIILQPPTATLDFKQLNVTISTPYQRNGIRMDGPRGHVYNGWVEISGYNTAPPTPVWFNSCQECNYQSFVDAAIINKLVVCALSIHVEAMILGLCPANERRRYFVTTSLIGWEQS